MRTSRQNYLRNTNGALWEKPANGVESKYLLTGMALCGVCGGGLIAYPRTHGSPGKRKRAHVYACPRAKVDRCSNDLEVLMPTADAAALAMMTDDVLAPEVVESAIAKLLKMVDGAPEETGAKRKRLTTVLSKTETELANLAAAVAAGSAETLVAGIRERERQAKQLRAELAALDAGPELRGRAIEIREAALRLLDDWRGLLGRNVATSRQLLRKLLDRERFVFYPKAGRSERWYDVAVRASLDRFVGAIEPLKKAVASPTGFEPVFQP